MIASSHQINSFVKQNYISGLKNKKLWFVLLVANLFALPYACFTYSIIGMDSFACVSVAALAMVVNMLMGMVIPFILFDYCYTKTKVDMAYALPLSRKQKYLSDFFAGLTIYVSTYILQMILVYGVWGLSWILDRRTDWINLLGGSKAYAGFDGITIIMLKILLIQIMLYVVTTLIISCTGAVFEAISATIYVNILLPTTILVISTFCENQLFGMTFYDRTLDIIYKTSPLGGFISLTNNNMFELFGKWAISYIAVILIYFAVAYVIMTRRKAESVGTPFVIRSLYHIVLVAVMFHIGLLACYSSNSFVMFIMLTAVFYLIIETVTNRGFKRLKTSCIRYVTIIGTVLVTMFVIKKTSCFGIAYHVANVKDVSSITIETSPYFNEHYYETMTLKEKENIERILSIQKHLIQTYKEEKKVKGIAELFDWEFGNHYYYQGNQFNHPMKITVNGKDKYTRRYELSIDEMNDLLEVTLSDEFIDQYVNSIYENIRELKITDIFYANQKIIVPYSEKKSEVIHEFLQCLAKDMKNISKEEYLRPEKASKYCVNLGYYDIVILDSYTNTIEWLKEQNALPEVSTDDIKNLLKNESVYLLPPSESQEDSYNDYYNYDMGVYETYSYNSRTIDTYSDEVEELFRVAQAQYVAAEPCYKLYVYGTAYVIPPKYNQLARKVYEGNTSLQ